MDMADGNAAALSRKMRDDDRDEELMVMARADRPRLVGEYIADPDMKNQDALQNLLADMVCDSARFLNGLQRIHVIAASPLTAESMERAGATAIAMARLFADYVDTVEGDDLVNDEANRLAMEL